MMSSSPPSSAGGSSPPNNESASALVIAASHKAGMEGIDRRRIDEIILRESGQSAYMKKQRKSDEAVNVKIERMKKRLRNSRDFDKDRIERQLQPEILQLQKEQRFRSTCVVVDMDMFYFSCELLTRPELKDVPACVGDSMILTSNYCARKYGVRSAMAGWIGDKLVSELSNGKQRLIHVPSHHELYKEKSLQVRNVLAEYDPDMRAYSLDEAYICLGPYLVLQLENPTWTHDQIRTELQKKATENDTDKSAIDTDEQSLAVDEVLSKFPSNQVLSVASRVVQEMRAKVKEATGGLTCSAGLAPNFMLAKIASDRNKPNGQLVVGPSHEEILEFVHPLATRKIPGIGRVTEKVLQAFDITTVQQLYEERALIRYLFSPATARFLLRASLGCGSTEHHTAEEQKGISREQTFRSGNVQARLHDIAHTLSADMVRKDLRAHTLTVKVKLDTFDIMSKSRSMPRGVYLQAPDELESLASQLLGELRKEHKGQFSVRLLGIRCTNFQHDDQDASQLNMDQFLCNNSQRRNDDGGKKRAASPIPTNSAQKRGDVGTKKRAASPIFSSQKKIDIAIKRPPSSVATTCPRETAQEHSVATSDESTAEVHCPMCGQAIRNPDNDAINRHIDSCLNSSMIRKAVQEESMAACQRQERKKQRLTDFFRAV